MTEFDHARMLATTVGDSNRQTSSIALSREVELDAVAEQLIALARKLRGHLRDANERASVAQAITHSIAHPDQVRSANVELAREIYYTRRSREAIFGNPELFGEPAWDILLDLYIADVEDKAVSVSSACIGSAAPPTTGLRWLGVLAEQGLVLREHDPDDQRRVLVRLTDTALRAMDEYFAAATGAV